MQATDVFVPALCLVAGLALGAGFFGSLWWTVQKTASGTSSILLQIASPALRLALTLAGFYLVGGGNAVRLVSCLAGFVIARWIATRCARAPCGPVDCEETSRATRT